jgi:hypothetical protein
LWCRIPCRRIGNDHLTGTFTAPAALAAGQSADRHVRVTVPALSAGTKYFVIRAKGGGEVFESNFDNNSTIASTATALPAVLSLQLSRTATPESGTPIAATLMRNGDMTTSLAVSLSATPAGNVLLLATVTIPANAATANFNVQPIDDTLLNGDRTVTLTGRATGYADGTAALAISDDDVPMLTVSVTPASVSETAANPAATGTVQRNTAIDQPLTVMLLSSNPGAAVTAASVTIPAGATAATFSITEVDDLIVTDPRTVRITASAAGLATGSTTLEVTDADIPSLSLQLTPAAVAETAGNPAVSGRVVFTHALTRNEIVTLASGDPGSASVPATVTIPAGANFADFPIAVANHQSTSERDITITATQTDSVLHLPIPVQSDRQTLRIFGGAGATLTLSGPGSFAPRPALAVSGFDGRTPAGNQRQCRRGTRERQCRRHRSGERQYSRWPGLRAVSSAGQRDRRRDDHGLGRRLQPGHHGRDRHGHQPARSRGRCDRPFQNLRRER